MQKGDKKKEKYRVGEIVWIKTKFLQLKFLTQIVWRIDIQIIGDLGSGACKFKIQLNLQLSQVIFIWISFQLKSEKNVIACWYNT